MPYKAWTVTVEGKDHPVELSWGDFWGNFKLRVDGAVVKRRLLEWGFGATVDFKVAGMSAKLSGTSGLIGPTKWELYVGGKLVAPPAERAGGGLTKLHRYDSLVTPVTIGVSEPVRRPWSSE